MNIEMVYSEGKLIRIDIKNNQDKQIVPGTDNYKQLVLCLADELLTREIENINTIKSILGESVKGWSPKDYEEFQQAVIEEKTKKYENQERTVTLTNKQRNTLHFYIMATTHYRQKESESWAELAKEKNEDGSPRFQKAADSAAFWKGITKDLEEIEQAIKR